MRHPAEGLIGSGLLSRQRLAQRHLLGALIASVVLHGVLLGQLAGTQPRPAPEPVPSVLITHLWLAAPPWKPPPQLAPIAPAERAAAAKQNTRRTGRPPQASVADAPSAAAMPVDTHTVQSVEPPPSAPSSPHSGRPLDLSPQVISQAVRRNASPGLAQAAREQLGIGPAPSARALERQMASAAVPDCLHNAPDGEAKSGPATIGGLFALPFVAYAAMTGKCK